LHNETKREFLSTAHFVTGGYLIFLSDYSFWNEWLLIYFEWLLILSYVVDPVFMIGIILKKNYPFLSNSKNHVHLCD
jgi:hypothetical protein